MNLSVLLQHKVLPISDCYAFKSFAGNCEKRWAEKITVQWRQEQFLAIWGFVRFELASYLNLAPEDMVFERTDHGKPYLKYPCLSFAFNLSHTKDHLALCYAKDILACGIDIEVMRDMDDMLAIAKRFFAPAEFLFLNTLDDISKQKFYFFKLWVIKEAVLKAIGKGLSYGIEKVFITDFASLEQGDIVLIVDGQEKKLQWQFFADSHVNSFKALAVEV